jgi:16S rRNA (cytosine967-C5)-methyltransferase
VKHWLKEDGLLIYCTCSLQKDEGERQIENFLQQNPAFSRDKTMMIDAQFLTKDGDARLLPTYGSMDGFFISYLRFKSSSFDKTP